MARCNKNLNDGVKSRLGCGQDTTKTSYMMGSSHSRVVRETSCNPVAKPGSVLIEMRTACSRMAPTSSTGSSTDHAAALCAMVSRDDLSVREFKRAAGRRKQLEPLRTVPFLNHLDFRMQITELRSDIKFSSCLILSPVCGIRCPCPRLESAMITSISAIRGRFHGLAPFLHQLLLLSVHTHVLRSNV